MYSHLHKLNLPVITFCPFDLVSVCFVRPWRVLKQLNTLAKLKILVNLRGKLRAMKVLKTPES